MTATEENRREETEGIPSSPSNTVGRAVPDAHEREHITSVRHQGERYYQVTSAQVYSQHSRWWLDQHVRQGHLIKYTLPEQGGNRVFYRKAELDALLDTTQQQRDPEAAVRQFGRYFGTAQVARYLACSHRTVIRMLKLGAFDALDPLTDEERARGQEEEVAPTKRWSLAGQQDEYRIHERALRAFTKQQTWRAVPGQAAGTLRWQRRRPHDSGEQDL